MTHRLPYLDLARGIAALCVLAFHYSTALHALDPSWPILPLGDVGVRAFFIISGFVITGSAMRSTSRGAFAWARFVRLYPAFLACLGLTTLWLLALRLVPYQITPTDWALNLTMVPGWFGAKMADSVYWTLAYEIGFYATVCAALPLLRAGRYPGLPIEPPGSSAVSGFVPRTTILTQDRLPTTDGSSVQLKSVSAFHAAAARYYSTRLTPALWLCAASLPVLWWQPLVLWFLIGVVAHEIVPSFNLAPRIAFLAPKVQFSTWAGAVSYPLYLLHCKIGVSLIFILAPLGLLPAALLTTGTMLVLATLVNRMVEVPAQAAMKRWGKPMANMVPVTA